jgi:hypothetical protein
MLKIKVKNMIGFSGNEIANQFILSQKINSGILEYFQSYDSIIAKKTPSGQITLDKQYWDYSNTTSKYRNQFLNETTKETRKKIESGEYKLANLN